MRPLLLAAMLCFAARGQQNNTQPAPHFSVHGRVVNAVTGEPVRGALVSLMSPEMHNAFSGSDGQFEVDNVSAGNFIVSAQHPGYQGRMQAGRPQIINVSDNLDGVVVKMPPAARVSGIARDTDGEPVEGLAVNLSLQVIINGRKTWQQSAGGTTDEGGAFVIDNLQAGAYLLNTTLKAVYPGAPANGEAARLTYAAQYYPNTTDLASAQVVDVNPGDDSHFDLTVSAVRGARVSFAVDPPANFVWGSLESAGGLEIRTGFPRNPKTGKFFVPSVPPGSWTLSVRAQQQNDRGPGTAGEAFINVGSVDLDNVVISLAPPIEIPVIIIGGDAPPLANDTPPPSASRRGVLSTSAKAAQSQGGSTRVQLMTVSEGRANSMYKGGMVSMPSQQGGFAIQNVMAGTYRVNVQTFTGNTCLDTVTSGSLDLTRNDLVISPGTAPQPINVTLQNNCAEIDVNSKSDATVVVIPDSHAKDPIIVNTKAASPATLKNLGAGDYVMYAFTDVNGLEYANPEAMRNFSGQHVTLTAGQKVTLTVDVNDREAR